ncbi:MAG TPA: trypsin-like peptidase domain-containing protein [Pseudonocardiaceae bacterium]|jgi:S1-C subfamily serine protease|nr:trypsin-like peptidase domain-containing protein [Pseudonocardiaceae bacterium]
MKLSRPALATVLTIGAIALAGCAADGTAMQTSSSPSSVSANAPTLEQTYVSVVQKVLPSVVQITSGRDLGSGIVFDTKGDIVTNAHVVGQATTFQVRLADSPKAVPATLVGAYQPDDLAVIKLDQPPTSLHPAHFGDSARLQVGEMVLAMGNPLGLTGSVTNGIISATGRTVTEPAGNGPGATLPDVIQTSAAVNPGNSGGALVDLAGDVIGVPTLAALEPQTGGLGSSAAPGIGFAIPSNLVTDIAGQLIAHGHVVNSHRAELGIGVVTVVGASDQPAGVGVVSVVAGGPAAAAGMQPGDVITAINNTPVGGVPELAQVLATLDPGQRVSVTLTTPGGSTRTVTVTLAQLAGS